jgi:hypothetical protein
MLAQLFRHGELTYYGGFVNLATGRIAPLMAAIHASAGGDRQTQTHHREPKVKASSHSSQRNRLRVLLNNREDSRSTQLRPCTASQTRPFK